MDTLKVKKTFFYQNKSSFQQLFFYHQMRASRIIQPIVIWLFISISLISQTTGANPTPNSPWLYSFLNLPDFSGKEEWLLDFYLRQYDKLNDNNFKHCPGLNKTCVQLPPSSYLNITAYPLLRSGNFYGASADTSQSTPFIQAYPRENWENNYGVDLLQSASSHIKIKGVPVSDGSFNFFNPYDILTEPLEFDDIAESSRFRYEVVQVLSLNARSFESGSEGVNPLTRRPLDIDGASSRPPLEVFTILFTIRKTSDEPPQGAEQSASAQNDSNMAFGYIIGTNHLDSSNNGEDGDAPVLARGWLAPSWELLIRSLDRREIGYIITYLNVSPNLKEELHKELRKDEGALRLRLIELLENAK